MKTYIHDDFLLQSETARTLYHQFAADEPIYDYHCHLPQRQILDNHQFSDLSEIWLGGDHYKWRALRANGVAERLITGDGSPREKFDAWVSTMPYALRNPLYQWSHLELVRTFGIDLPINSANADAIWSLANERLKSLRVHDILAMNKVAVICTTDDPADPLDDHEAIAKTDLKTKVYPAFRPDKALGVDTPDAYRPWLEKLERTATRSIQTFEDLLAALKNRHEAFHSIGGRLSDHGLDVALGRPCSHAEASRIFANARDGVAASTEEKQGFGALLMIEFGRWDAEKGWTKQLHLGALRSANSRARIEIGPDTGFDSIGDTPQARGLADYMDALEQSGELPRMVLYNVNPTDNYMLASMAGNFQGGGIPGKIQFGSGWWYLDQKEGIEWQLNALSQIGLLRRFVGMLTDSRSFLSYTRHEFFRRVLCNLLGGEMERGEMPDDIELVGTMVKEICFANARDFFRLELHDGYRS